MRITFGENSANKPNVRLYSMRNRAVKVADFTDEQVTQINKTKKLPEGYHLVYNLDKYGRGSMFAHYEMTVTKDLPKLHPLQKPFYFDTLQNGYELENYQGKTYLRETGTTVKDIKSRDKINWIRASISCALLIIFAALTGKIFSKK